jgi:hypothetical protein
MRRLSVLFICFPWLAGACSCVYPNQPNAREAAYAVFDGVVTDVHYFKSEQDGRTLVTFDISRSWKGSVGSTIKVHAEERALMCDSYVFELGHRYIVYAIQQDSEAGWSDQYPAGTKILGVGGCILRIREDIKAEASKLGKGRKPN